MPTHQKKTMQDDDQEQEETMHPTSTPLDGSSNKGMEWNEMK
jgi:hypothetical protein